MAAAKFVIEWTWIRQSYSCVEIQTPEGAKPQLKAMLSISFAQFEIRWIRQLPERKQIAYRQLYRLLVTTFCLRVEGWAAPKPENPWPKGSEVRREYIR